MSPRRKTIAEEKADVINATENIESEEGLQALSEEIKELSDAVVAIANNDNSEEVDPLVQYFIDNNIPFCPVCKKQFVTSFNGSAICPANNPPDTCPRL